MAEKTSWSTVDITDCPYYLIARTSLVMTRALRGGLEKIGASHIRPAYLGVLMCLWRQDGVKVVDLGRCAGLEPSTMTGLLDRMERDGLVQRKPNPRDRRAQLIFLTELGREVEGSVNAVIDQTLDHILRGIPERDLTVLRRTLRKLLTNVLEEDRP